MASTPLAAGAEADGSSACSPAGAEDEAAAATLWQLAADGDALDVPSVVPPQASSAAPIALGVGVGVGVGVGMGVGVGVVGPSSAG